jgi:hypothetical protein
MRRFVIAVLLLGLADTASAQGHARTGARRSWPPAAAVAPRQVFVSPYYQPLPYAFYYQQELQKRWPPRPRATQSFEGSSPRCPKFFCEERP